MPETLDQSNVYTQLRETAVTHLQTGTTPPTGYWSVGVDALRLLHRLSSNPDNAEDALKLLHELQVHQVELDLQHEEIAANEQALEEDLHLYRILFDSAPLAYFVVDLAGVIIKGNLAAAELYGIDQADLEGRRIDTLLNLQNRPPLLGLLQRVAQTGTRDSCVAEMGDGAPGSRHVHFQATRASERDTLLLACCEGTSED